VDTREHPQVPHVVRPSDEWLFREHSTMYMQGHGRRHTLTSLRVSTEEEA
jgi:hypothetical protein